MKRFLLFWTIIAIILVAPAQERVTSNNANDLALCETHVTPAEALNVGYTFMRTGAGMRGSGTRSSDVRKQTMQLIYTGRAVDSTTRAITDCYYVFALQPKGFVIVAADSRVEPILGYSYENDFVVENMPAHVRGWLGHYEKQIEAVVKQDIAPEAETTTKWSRLRAGQVMSNTRDGNSVGPLLTTQWGQGWPYNAMCPIDSLAGEAYHYRCPTGCVATAFAQIMNYWQYPERGRGEYGGIWYNEATYQWDIMDINHIDEISKLMYHIGVGANMVYGPTASSANIAAGRLSLVEWYEYENAEELNRSDFSDDTWTLLLDSLLRDSIPVVYGGFTSEDNWSTVGHAWVCDGYDANGLYHMNWGWDGGLDGYFNVHSLLNGFSCLQTINYVRPGQSPLLSRFKYEPNQLNPTIIQFVDQSYSFPETFYWDFGDGSTSSQINPIHEYAAPGEYLVTHTVCKDGFCDSEEVMIGVFSYSFIWNGDTLSPHDGESRPLVIDYDMDGKQDFLISSSPYDMLVGGPDGWRNYISNPTTLYRNVDSTFIPIQLEYASSLPPLVVDINNENKPSVLLDGLYLHNVNGTLIADSILTLQSALSHGERFSVVDYNNDGRMDVMIGDTLYKNIGGGLFRPAYSMPFGRTWLDYDKDGDMDLLTNQGIKSSVYRNNGDGTFSRQTVEGNYLYTLQSIDSTSGIWFDVSDYGDIDGDGWMDFIDGERTVWNRGNNYFETDVYGGEICSDYTLEGTIDRIYASGDGFKLYEDGEFTFNRTLYPNFGIYGNTPASLAFIDRDGDNRPDLLATGFCEYEGFYGNSTIVYDNNSPFENLPPSPPTGLSASVTGNNVVLSWQPSTDDHNSVAITYNIAVGTSPNDCDVFSPLSNLETGKRYAYNKGNAGNVTLWKVNDLPNGTYYWRVQAIDNAMASSAFSSVNTFVINHDNLPPAMANMTKKGYVGKSITFEKDDFTNIFFDPEYDTLHSIKICTLPENGTLQLSGVPVELDQIIPASSLDELSYKSGQPGTCTFDVQPYDGYNFSIDTTHICINTAIFEQTNVLLADNISALAWGDFDNDGDADLATNTGIWRNDSGTFTQTLTSPVAASSVQWVDFNHDGLLDCLFDMTICMNQGFGVFSAQSSLETSMNMRTAIMDLNTDNHPDIVITQNNMSSTVFFNTANGYNVDSIQTLWNNSSIGSIAVGDYDRDGDEDIIMVEEETLKAQLLNNRDGMLFDTATQIANYNIGTSDWGDYDKDGDLDFIGTVDNTGLKIYNNDGMGNFNEVFTGLCPLVYAGFVKWFDYNNDGYLDILAGGYGSDDKPTCFLLKNNQGTNFAKVDNINLPAFINLHCAIGDYDHDGFGDMAISGTDESGTARICFYHNCMGKTDDSLPQTLAVPQNLTSTVVGSKVHLNWNDTTWGCSYNVYIRKSDDSYYVVSPLADVQTGTRYVSAIGNTGTMKSLDIHSLQEGTYFWSVQSLDAAYHGSAFASEHTFEIGCGESVSYDFYDTAHAVYVWDGAYYATSGVYSKIFESSTGCDSIVRLHLTIDSLERGIVYVTQNGSGNKSGYSWDDAMDDLQQAIITSAYRNSVVWVAEGIYTNEKSAQIQVSRIPEIVPCLVATDIVTIDVAFVIPSLTDVSIYGGFSGTEPADYDLNHRNFKEHETILDGLNRMNVLYKGGGANNTIVDGFTIQHGYGEYGGGVFVNSWDNCPFVVKNCCIKNNMSSGYGGGFCGSLFDSNPLAIAMNCLITNNRAWQEGGVSSLTLINSTVVLNTADYDNGFGHAECYNSIIWGNVPSEGTYYTSSAYSTALQFELIGNIDDNCFYLDANNDGGDTNVHFVRFVDPENGDFRLSCGSACINMGMSDISGLDLPSVDLQGNPRVMDGRIDIGAYEFDTSLNVYYTITALPNTETGGTVANGGVYTYGQICHLSASANEGYDFLYWLENGEIISDNLEYSFMVSSDRNISAVFVEEGTACGITFELSGWYPSNKLIVNMDSTSEHLSTEFGGVSYAAFTRYVEDGSILSLSFIPSILSWECELAIYDANGNLIHHASNLDENFHYDFLYHCDGSISYIVNASANPEEGGTVTGAGTYNPGVTATLTATPNEGFSFVNWKKDGEIVSTDSTYSFTVIESASLVAFFTWDGTIVSICQNQLPYTYGDTVFDVDATSGVYRVVVDDIPTNIYFQINPSFVLFDTLAACDNGWLWVGDVCLYDSLPGDYQILLQSSCGCDSIVNLHYVVNQSYWFDLYDTIPRGTEYSANGFYISAEETRYIRQGDWYNWYWTSMGCDSVCVLHLMLTGAPIQYVTQNGTGDGSSWENAMGDLQSALNSATSVQGDVWVAQGTYYGDGVSENAFVIPDGVHVYGGFAGNEPADYDLSLRDFTAHPTVLDGQHVQRTVFHDWTWNLSPVIDGFTIRNGHSSTGGNIFGGGPKLQVTNCTIQDGVSDDEAGGLYNASVRNSLIINNTSSYWGSALKDCDAYNCVITGNNATEYGYTALWSTLTNCIVWNNIGYPDYGNSITYSAVEGQGVWGDGNITLAHANDGASTDSNYVRFVDPENGDFRLSYGSACINAGTPDISGLGLPSVDLQGLPRALDGRIEMGAYEYYPMHVVETYDTVCEGNSIVFFDSTCTVEGSYVHHANAEDVTLDTLHVLQLTVNQPTFGDTTVVVCESFTWYGSIYTESGDYTFYTTNMAGCDSVVTLHLTVNHGTHNAVTETACDSYEWNEVNYTESGIYTYEYTNEEGCPSVDTLYLTINYSTTGIDEQTACESFTWIDGVTYTESTNEPTYTLTNAAGCDSVVTLHLTINNPQHESSSEIAYDSYEWNGETYDTTGVYTYEHQDDNGCMQVDTLHLTVYYSSSSDIYQTACEFFIWNGEIFTTSGEYERHFTDIHGADSAVTLHLTINHGTHNAATVTECDAYEWNNETYTESGIYTYEYTNEAGCPSVDTLYLTVNYSTTGIDEQTACESFTWIDGVTYTESTNEPTYTLTNAAGCDSVVTLHLTVTNTDHTDFTDAACDSYAWNGETYTESGTYTQTFTNSAGCDSVVTLHLTIFPSVTSEFSVLTEDSCYIWNNIEYCTSGDYTQTLQTVHGCDSVVTLHLTITVGIDNHKTVDFRVYPNPTNGIVNVDYTMNNVQYGELEIQVVDMYGKLVRIVETQLIASLQRTTIDLSDLANGVYFVKAMADGKVVAVRKVVKN